MLMKSSRKANQTQKNKGPGSGKEGDNKPEGGGKLRKKFKQAVKMPNVLKTFMSVLAEEEKTNKYLLAAFQYAQTMDTTPDP